MKYIFEGFVVQSLGKSEEEVVGGITIFYQKYKMVTEKTLQPGILADTMSRALKYENKEMVALNRLWGLNRFEIAFVQEKVKANVVRNKYGR